MGQRRHPHERVGRLVITEQCPRPSSIAGRYSSRYLSSRQSSHCARGRLGSTGPARCPGAQHSSCSGRARRAGGGVRATAGGDGVPVARSPVAFSISAPQPRTSAQNASAPSAPSLDTTISGHAASCPSARARLPAITRRSAPYPCDPQTRRSSSAETPASASGTDRVWGFVGPRAWPRAEPAEARPRRGAAPCGTCLGSS
jgi:hypothetical protein